MVNLACTTKPIKPLPPVQGWGCTTGLGKSHQLRDMAANYIRQLRKHGDNGTAIVFLPTHRLGQEQVGKFNAEHEGLTARRFLGIAQPDPDTPGKSMCHRHQIVADLCKDGASMRDLCAKPKLGSYCPHHVEIADEPCGYSVQAQHTADIWFLPQQMLFAKAPRCVGKPALIGIDEAFWQASLKGFNPPYRLRLETLVSNRGVKGSLDPMRELAIISDLIHDAIWPLPDGFIDTSKIDADLGMNAEKDCTTAHRLEIGRLSSVKVNPSMSEKMLQQELEKLTPMSIMRLAKFWELLRLAVVEGGVTPFIKKQTIEDSEGVTTWLHLYSRESIHTDWLQPTVLLDATMPVEINKTFFPQISVKRFDCPMQHTKTTQILDKTLSKAMMLPSEKTTERKQAERRRNLDRLLSLCQVLVSRNYSCVLVDDKPVKLLLITSKAVEEKLLGIGLPEGVATLHLGATSGLDGFRDVPCIVMAGRLELPLRIAEHQASVLQGGMVDTSPDTDEAWYPRKLSGIETPDDVKGVLATSHPDPLVEEVRWAWNEGQVIQAIGRGRAVRRTADNPLELFVLTNVPLPIVVDHAVNWEDVIPTIVEQVLADVGVSPLSRKEMVRVKSDVWLTERKARYAVDKFVERYSEAATGACATNLMDKMPIVNTYRQNGQQMRLFDRLLLVEYTRSEKGAKPCRAVIRKGHGHSSGKRALANLIGELKRYRVICVMQSTKPIHPPQIEAPCTLHYNAETELWRPGSATTQNPACGMTKIGRVYYSIPMTGACK